MRLVIVGGSMVGRRTAELARELAGRMLDDVTIYKPSAVGRTEFSNDFWSGTLGVSYEPRAKEAEPKRITYGPPKKGKGGKVKRW